MRVVIADAGPLIALSRIDRLAILEALFQQVVLTEIVRDEVLNNDHCLGHEAIQTAIDANWLSVEKVDLKDWKPINSGVDAGEASAIFLASQSEEALLIIDDQAGRAEARYQNIAIIGTAAVIGIAKEQGVIDSARMVLTELCDAGYYIGESIIQTVLDDIGEQ